MSSRHPSRPRRPAAPWRALAGLLAAMVLGLGMAAVSPETHAWMHGDQLPVHEACEHPTPAPADADHGDHACAVVLFASGVDLPLCHLYVSRFHPEAETFCRAPAALYLAQPRYLRQPERGPPVA